MQNLREFLNENIITMKLLIQIFIFSTLISCKQDTPRDILINFNNAVYEKDYDKAEKYVTDECRSNWSFYKIWLTEIKNLKIINEDYSLNHSICRIKTIQKNKLDSTLNDTILYFVIIEKGEWKLDISKNAGDHKYEFIEFN